MYESTEQAIDKATELNRRDDEEYHKRDGAYWDAYLESFRDDGSGEPPEFAPSLETLEAAYRIYGPGEFDRDAFAKWVDRRSDAYGNGSFFEAWPDNAITESNQKICERILDRFDTEWWRETPIRLTVQLRYEAQDPDTPTTAAAFMYGVERHIEDVYAILDEDDCGEREERWLWETFAEWTKGLIPADVDKEAVYEAWLEDAQPVSGESGPDTGKLPAYITTARRLTAAA